ncbi:hypothetical protein CANTEDRAFT_114669 [Yamadazyma tenuis ATCC 10573]|uniref:Carboxypeptidase n=1 Tax=Candida tenuis (strain ATCC 10573 / BCRC 21748 / CBS 615 / JCM 9827 / NBRC 10315 / NRRL Y-1498 / VKM Y-70) TaxID=590646 RepID=G3B620_CANTC|nr:uncharacterized protein CANTEDRAFT_114669 [Yamadazyma tenuis ATCC 10573]EGV63647.1 hypothetical protein CANTEDRAFT_114669 [Yamadazyma tenuis ATCC 10573]
MKLSVALVQLALAVVAIGFPTFEQNVFSNKHQVLLDNPQVLQEYHTLKSNFPGAEEGFGIENIEQAWKHLLHEVSVPELEKYFKKAEYAKKIDTEQFEVVSHEDHSNHQLRIKKTDPYSLGLDTVQQYVGYMDVRDVDKHFFYWFFESRNDPKSDPVVLWINGGPGCSSEGGLLFELGPSFIDVNLKPVFNPYSWNSNASVIFLDQPVGTGYSYAGNEDVATSTDAAKDVYVFLELFFQKFPQFLGNKFHVSGESYAGHYIPRIGAEIISHPERSFELSSLLIGNGYVDAYFQQSYDQKMLCGEGGIDVITEEECEQMDQYLKPCLAFQGVCEVTGSALACVPSIYYCAMAYDPLTKLNLNPYDLRRPCETEGLCYNEIDYMSDFMNLNSTKEAAGVPSDLTFGMCNHEVGKRFNDKHDGIVPFQTYIGEVLDYGIPVLHYAGDKDFVCHWLGYNAVSNTVKYKNQANFTEAEFKPWVSKSGKEIGQVRGFDKFTFLRVYDAGHMVPHDQPEVAYEMLETWLSGDYSFGY